MRNPFRRTKTAEPSRLDMRAPDRQYVNTMAGTKRLRRDTGKTWQDVVKPGDQPPARRAGLDRVPARLTKLPTPEALAELTVDAEDVMPYALPRAMRRASRSRATKIMDRKPGRSAAVHARKLPPSIATHVAVPTRKAKGNKTTRRVQIVVPK